MQAEGGRKGGISKQPHGRLGAAACQETPQSQAARRATSTRTPRAWPGSQHGSFPISMKFTEVQAGIHPCSVPRGCAQGRTLSSWTPGMGYHLLWAPSSCSQRGSSAQKRELAPITTALVGIIRGLLLYPTAAHSHKSLGNFHPFFNFD